ncbi:hypothetical protein Back11_48780 [Paenibacillus baekrokdamisoli]|uniref:Uncharacterized protein n=1 Tax=Paenibacillus baekrokdamisoli TaxID=1712516 RepID=A0A3G9JEZ1_9BACL|nr:AraC family transcriptional regulator [Paenibacillus baekrokdamisoli]MBB3068703.1 AraC-like DNA-binding protein/uncharacterized membrane protein YciS (DUF1049 family) [Paenibacillus baekrokdamisoli]BBH23533.1 hypothetical protein Back11_48780 [Paenibacillus baekrokdamisoli]
MITFLQKKRNSFFFKLLLSFLIIVMISFIFNLLSFNFFQKTLRTEIIKYNKLTMSNTVNNYEKQFRLLDDITTNLYVGTDMSILKKKNSDFIAMNSLAAEINAILSNYNNLNLENLFFYNSSLSFIIDKKGLNSIPEMFENSYINADYNADFWEKQIEEDYHMRIFPAARFQKRNFNGKIEDAGLYFPIIIKNVLQKQSYIAAFINADAIYLNSHFSTNDLFFISDDKGTLFFNTPQSKAFTNYKITRTEQAYDSSNHNYYFYQKGEKSNLIYINVTPNQQIASTVSRLSWILLILFALSLVLSLLISILFSIRFKLPVQRILDSLQMMNPNFHLRSTIREYIQIGDRLKTIINSNQKINQDLQMKDSLLKTYGYWNKVKNIPLGSKDMQSLIDSTKPFYFIMFQLQSAHPIHETSQDMQTTAHFMEIINLNIQCSFIQSEILQIERDLIVAIIFSENDLQDQHKLTETLHILTEKFNQQEQYYITIATNLRLQNPSDFTVAYEETLEMIRERKLNADIQIITKLSHVQNRFQIAPPELMKLSAQIEAGNTADILQSIRRMLQRLSVNGIALEYKQMASDIISQILLNLMSQKIEVGELLAELTPYEQIKEFVSEEQYLTFYISLVEKAASLISIKNAGKDPIVDYVIAYIEHHSGGDISQEAIASKLNLSIRYMGKYIKNKTGKTFNDYLEDVRIRKAKIILMETDDKIQEVANKVGYHNANSFTRMFKRITGLTPGDYRAQSWRSPFSETDGEITHRIAPHIDDKDLG